MSSSLDNADLYTLDDAAKYLGLSKAQLKVWRTNRGKGTGEQGPEFIRLGHKTLRYKLSDLNAFAESKKGGAA